MKTRALQRRYGHTKLKHVERAEAIAKDLSARVFSQRRRFCIGRDKFEKMIVDLFSRGYQSGAYDAQMAQLEAARARAS